MPYLSAGRTDYLVRCGLNDHLGSENAGDGGRTDEAPTSTTVANHNLSWAGKSTFPGGAVAGSTLENGSGRSWAHLKRSPAALSAPRTCSLSRCHPGWACGQPVGGTFSSGVTSLHRIYLYEKPLGQWAAGPGRSRGSCGKRDVHAGNPNNSPVLDWSNPGVAPVAPPLEMRPMPSPALPPPSTSPLLELGTAPSTSGTTQAAQQQQQQQRARAPRQAGNTPELPYSVPTLAVGDVFLSCNTVAGLEHADDWDLGSLGSRLVGTASTPHASGQGSAPHQQQQQQQQEPSQQHQQPQHHRAQAAQPRVSPLDPGSELLLRMSSWVGGQRLMFVSKESAELVRRALLLSRYDEIMEKRRAEAEAEEEEGEDAGGSALYGTAVTAADAQATVVTVRTGSRSGPSTAGRGGHGGGANGVINGSEEDGGRALLPPWLRKPSADPATARAAAAPPSKAVPGPDTNPTSKLQASSSTSEAPPSVALLGGGGTGNGGDGSASGGGGAAATAGSSGGGGGGAVQDLHVDVPEWVPTPLREATQAVVRGVGGWLNHTAASIGGAIVRDAIADSASGVGGGSVQQGVAALFRRGGSGGALDVSTGPRPRLPAPPVTSAMQLPPLTAARPPPPPPPPPLSAAAEAEGPPPQQQQTGLEVAATARLGRVGSETASERKRWDTEALMQELKQLEEEKVISDAEALLESMGRGSAGGAAGAAGEGFLPPFSFSSYVARLPLEAALQALLSAPSNEAAAAAAAAATFATAGSGSGGGGDAVAGTNVPAVAPPAAPVRRRFLLVPDSADEQAVEGSRELERLMAEVEAAAAAAVAAASEADSAEGVGSDGGGGGEAEDVAAGSRGRTTAAKAAVKPKNAAPRPRVALNLYDSDASHWVLDVVDELEQDGSEGDGGGSGTSNGSSSSQISSGSSSNNNNSSSGGTSQQVSLPVERFMRGAPSGPSEDLGGLVSLASGEAAIDTHAPQAAAAGGRRSLAITNADGVRSEGRSASPEGATGGAGGRGGSQPGGRTPVFLLPGVTVSVRALDGTVLRLRPAFLSLQQLAAALALARDAAAAAWRRQRSAARWKVVSALDVLTVHGAGFPIMRLPPVSSAAGGGGGGSAGGGAGGGGAGAGGDEDSDDGIPEAKELLREMGAGNRRPSAVDSVGAPTSSADTAPSGVMAVLSTLAVGVVSFSAWCIASAVDVWEDVYSRTPWGLEEIGVPQHVNVTPTYLEDHVNRLAEANGPTLAASAAAAHARAAQRAQEKRARRKQAAAQAQRQQAQEGLAQALGQQQQPGLPGTRPGSSDAGQPAGSSDSVPVGIAAQPGQLAAEAAAATGAGTAATANSQRRAQRAAAGSGGGGGSTVVSGFALQSETLAGLTVLLQFAWSAARTAHARVQREAADGLLGADAAASAGGVDGLLRLAGGRSSGGRDGGVLASGGGGTGGGGLTLTASQDGELGLVAKLDIRPVVTAAAQQLVVPAALGQAAAAATPGGGAAAKSEAGAAAASVGGEAANAPAAAAAAAAGAGAQGKGESAGAAPQQSPPQPWPLQQQPTQPHLSGSAAGAPPPPAAPAPAAAASPAAAPTGAAATPPGGLSIREVNPANQSGMRYELMQSSAKLASQVTRPHKFEVGLHLNLRKMLGDLPEDAPDQLLRLQQPAGPVPAGAVGPAAAGGGASGAALRRGPSPQAGAPLLEAHGIVLIGDLGFEELDDLGTWLRPPGLGFADLGGLLPPRRSSRRGAALEAAAAAAAAAALSSSGMYGLASDEEEDSGSDGGRGDGGGGGAGRGAGAGSGPTAGGIGAARTGARGWASGASRRGAWGRWGR